VEAHALSGLPPEQDVELREAEGEGVVLVDQCRADLTGERLGEPRRKLEAGETRTEDQYMLHGRTHQA
jgi:hypothetical protein